MCVVTSEAVTDTIFKLNQKTTMIAEHVLGVVGGEAVDHGLFHIN